MVRELRGVNADLREEQSSESLDERDKENESPRQILDISNFFSEDPVTVVVEPDLPQSVIVNNYCEYCKTSFAHKSSLNRHIKKSRTHAETVIKAQIERANAANANSPN